MNLHMAAKFNYDGLAYFQYFLDENIILVFTFWDHG